MLYKITTDQEQLINTLAKSRIANIAPCALYIIVFGQAPLLAGELAFKPYSDGPFNSASTANGDCYFSFNKDVYINGKCHMRVSQSDTGFFNLIIHSGKYTAMIDAEAGTGEARWNGPANEERLGYELGAVSRQGDCWANALAKVCAYGRAHSLQGKCRLIVKGHKYISGSCPIDIYKPFGSFYISSLEMSFPKYVASVAISGAIGRGSWSSWTGNNASGKFHDLGALHRKGACWINDEVEICAVQ